MKIDLVRKMVVAIATCIPKDEAAFAMLQQEFINGFNSYYRNKALNVASNGDKKVPVILDELINYTVKELPLRENVGTLSLSKLVSLESKTEISTKFINLSLAEMLTNLASRSTIKEAIRQYLHSKDKMNRHSVIDSNKFDTMFSHFLYKFKISSASNFQFTGTFLGYVMHSFSSYYLPDKSNNLWADLNVVDFAKREVETNLTDVNIITQQKRDDIYVRNFLINIAEANDLLFTHSGQSVAVHGVHYDIYYMLLNYLCSLRVDEINSKLAETPYNYTLKLIDEQDRKVTRPGFVANKGIANKISNAKMIVHYIFERLRSNNWDIYNINELRDVCFTLGKNDRDGRNCVWKDVKDKAETSRYFDSVMSAHNYTAFDLILKGVLSVIAIMKALEARGHSIIDVPKVYEEVFKNKKFPRSLDYLSSFWEIDIMDELQKEGDILISKGGFNKGELLTFDEMVHDYAGSEQNNHENIRRNRYEAYSRGFTRETKTKQSGSFQTFFEQMLSVADYMIAMPISYEECVKDSMKNYRLPSHYAPPVIIEGKDIFGGKYFSYYSNSFFVHNKELAKYYLYELANHTLSLEDYGWHIGESFLTSLLFTKNINTNNPTSDTCVYIPMVDMFLCCPNEQQDDYNGKIPARYLSDLQMERNKYYFNNTYNAVLCMQYVNLPVYLFSKVFKIGNAGLAEDGLYKSLGFSNFVSIGNYNKPEVLRRLEGIEVYHEYKDSTARYSEWMSTISVLQLSLIELLQTMLTYSLYTSRSFSGDISGQDEVQGNILLESLMKSSFRKSNLQWFFNKLDESMQRFKLKKIDFRWGSRNTNFVEFTELDLSILNIISNTYRPTSDDGEFMLNLLKFLSDYEDREERFIQLYNYLNIRLTFLKVLRDSFSLMFHVIRNSSVSTLGCELDSVFEICKTLNSFRDVTLLSGVSDNKLALLDTISVEEIESFASNVRNDCWESFSLLCNEMNRYVDKCRQDIADLVDYDISSSSQMHSKFQDWGNAFYTMPIYNNENALIILNGIKSRARVDDSGFLMCRNLYFRGSDGTNDYYVHTSGRMLADGPTIQGPVDFNFNNIEDINRYRSIIEEGRKRLGW